MNIIRKCARLACRSYIRHRRGESVERFNGRRFCSQSCSARCTNRGRQIQRKREVVEVIA